MQKKVYDEPFLSYEEQISLLKERGLFFKDEALALDLLKRVSYYRLSSYWYPFLEDTQNKIFRKNTDFDTVFELYEFDAGLRRIIMAELGNIEVAVRSKMVHTLSSSNGSFWLEKKDLFFGSEEYVKTISKIIGEINRNNESFIVSFKQEFSNEIPPAFMVMETTSFGTLSRLYKNLKLPKDKQEIARFFGLSGKVFGSWLHSLSYVRNICAHHARLWNRLLRIPPKDYESNQGTSKEIWLSNSQNRERIYIILSIIVYLLNAINPKHSFKQELKKLFHKYTNINKTAMGFPEDWEKEALWM